MRRVAKLWQQEVIGLSFSLRAAFAVRAVADQSQVFENVECAAGSHLVVPSTFCQEPDGSLGLQSAGFIGFAQQCLINIALGSGQNHSFASTSAIIVWLFGPRKIGSKGEELFNTKSVA